MLKTRNSALKDKAETKEMKFENIRKHQAMERVNEKINYKEYL